MIPSKDILVVLNKLREMTEEGMDGLQEDCGWYVDKKHPFLCLNLDTLVREGGDRYRSACNVVRGELEVALGGEPTAVSVVMNKNATCGPGYENVTDLANKWRLEFIDNLIDRVKSAEFWVPVGGKDEVDFNESQSSGMPYGTYGGF